MDDRQSSRIIAPSQGVHLVLEEQSWPDGNYGAPHRRRASSFAVPWLDKVVVGTTDTAISESSLEPRAYDEEIDFILKHAKRYTS